MRTAVLLNDTRCDRHFGCDAVVETIMKLAKDAELSITDTAPAHKDWAANQRFMKSFEAADIVIVNGEGTIHNDRPAARFLLNAAREAKRLRRPSALINSTWYRNGSEFCEKAKCFDLIAVRESSSARELDTVGLHVRTVPDLALLAPMPRNTKRSGLAYTDSVLTETSFQLHERLRRDDASYLSIFRRSDIVRDLTRSALRFVSGSPMRRPAGILEAARWGSKEALGRPSSRSSFLTELASKALLITGRFHAMVFAIASRTPFLVIDSNTPKNRALLADTGLGLWRSVTVDDITSEMIERAKYWEPDEKSALEPFVSRARDDAAQLFLDIAALGR